MEMPNQSKRSYESEAEFLANYRIEAYQQQSITADVAVFSMVDETVDNHRKDSKQKLHILLVKRGEHPFLHSWALPGGFMRPHETVEECALREIREETALTPSHMFPIGVFSKPDRDPRGRIVSNAFASIQREPTAVKGGSDAVSAKWFEVDFRCEPNGTVDLCLTSGDEVLQTRLEIQDCGLFGRKLNTLSDGGLAFDHGEIIATAMLAMRDAAEDYKIAFDFLPERFTLTALQRVQEILEGNSLLAANFRRKIAEFVEETEEFTEGAGHRPARLYKRKEK